MWSFSHASHPSVLLKDSPDLTGGQKLLCISGIEDCKKIVRRLSHLFKRPSHLVRRLLTLRKGEATDQVSLANNGNVYEPTYPPLMYTFQ